MTALRSTLFNAAVFVASWTVIIAAVPTLLGSRRATMRFAQAWARVVVALLRRICGIRVEVRGMEHVPAGACVIAAKHQSAFDTIIWHALLPDAAYVLKAELLRIPLFGPLARHAEMIPVDRAGGGGALRRMLRAAEAALAKGRQVVIFPEGTRTAPGERVPYQPGVLAIAAATDAPVVPVATDSGRLWGRRAFLKHPGVIRIVVMPPLPAGLGRAALHKALETAIEEESARLLAEPVDKLVH